MSRPVKQRLMTASAVMAAVLLGVGCGEETTADKLQDAADEASDKLEDAADDAKDAAEDAKDSIKDAIDDAKDG